MTVYIVNLLCEDDPDTTQIVGVYSTRALAEAACRSNDLAALDTNIEEWPVN